MSGTPRAGRNARIKIDTTSGATGAAATVTSKNKWTIDQAVDTIEVTAFEDTNKQYVVGLPNAQGTVEGFWDSADNNIYNLIGSTVPRQLYLYPDVTDNATSYFFTTAYFSVKSDGDVKQAVNFSLNWVAASPAVWIHP